MNGNHGKTPQMLRLQGGCMCGAVHYEIDGPLIAAVQCYCLTCRKLSGSGHAFHAVVPVEAMKIVGETKGFASTADSGNTVINDFCPTCGTPLFGRNLGAPGMIGFRVASLDDPSQIMPQMAVYIKRLQPWDLRNSALPAFMEMPAMSEKQE